MGVRAKDTVLVLTGKDRGKRGTVLTVDRERGRATVERVNMMKKHQKPNPRRSVQGGIVEREAPVNVSNLMVVCPRCDQPTRVRSLVQADGRRVRACRRPSCGAPFDR